MSIKIDIKRAVSDVLDVALTDKGYKVIECNNLNSAGFYAADVQKLVMEIESRL